MRKEQNPLRGWRIERAAIGTIGTDLERPECVIATRDGGLWVSDARGGVMRIGAGGGQRLIRAADRSTDRGVPGGRLPNGLSLGANGDVLVCDFAAGVLECLSADGRCHTVLDNIDGQPLGRLNFVLRDALDRLWLTVSTRGDPLAALHPGVADGYIAVLDGHGARIVADGLGFANEVRLDAAGEWLYVVESTRKRISRLRVGVEGTLSARETYGPSSLGAGFPDGIAFDAFGNLWCAMIMADRVIALTPEGDLLELLDDGPPAAVSALEREFRGGNLNLEVMLAARGTLAPWTSSLAFGGSDLQTVYLGSVAGTHIPWFRAPVPGLPLPHWLEPQRQ